MLKLLTPLGKIRIYSNEVEIEYKIIKLDNDQLRYPDIDGRYKIEVDYKNDEFPHFIYSVIEGIDTSKGKWHSESGENLECYSLYQDNIKISIGIKCNTYHLDGERISSYDYDCIYLNNGIGYNIFPNTKSQTIVFVVAWIVGYNIKNDIQTWLGVDLENE